MTVSSWDDLVSLARAIRAAEWFDEQERDYKLEIVPRLKSVLEAARDGGGWLSRLDELFRSGTYNLTNWRQNRWFLDWANASSRLLEVVAGFLDTERGHAERFNGFAQLAAADGV